MELALCFAIIDAIGVQLEGMFNWKELFDFLSLCLPMYQRKEWNELTFKERIMSWWKLFLKRCRVVNFQKTLYLSTDLSSISFPISITTNNVTHHRDEFREF